MPVGENTITVTSLNFLPDGTSPIPREAEAGKNQEPLPPEADNPAGLILYARVRAAAAPSASEGPARSTASTRTACAASGARA